VLIAEGLSKRYGACRALDGFDLVVQPGEIAGLVGHNGAGKTTFVEVVTGLVRPNAGRIRIAEVDALRNPRAARKLLGVAPQEQALYNTATVRDNLRLFGSLAGLRSGGLQAAIGAVAEELRLTDVLGQRVGLLSGGQRRRTQAATAMLGCPAVLLLDEPTAGADPETRAALLAAVRRRADAGAAVVYTTHYLPELTELGATLAVARCGRVIARGSQDSLISGLTGELRLRFDDGGPTTPIPAGLADRARTVEDELRIATASPAADLAAVLAAGYTPTSVDVRKPDLDDLYRALAMETVHAA
jgi:ABC-2 type transport system ATP-binding protein